MTVGNFIEETVAFITSRLDYCNSLLYGVPDHHIQKLQRIMDASARLILCAPKHCHITPLLQQLHELPICLHIKYKILLITLKVLQGTASKYLIDLISVLPPSRYEHPKAFHKRYRGRSILHGSRATALEPSSHKH